MKLLTWNIEWAAPSSPKGNRILPLIKEIDPDVVCYTEATLGMVPNTGYSLGAKVLKIIPKKLGPGKPLSDHVGVVSSVE